MHISTENIVFHNKICVAQKNQAPHPYPSPELFSLLLESEPLPCVVSQQDTIIFANQACQQFFSNWQSSKLFSNVLFNFITPAFHELLTDGISDLSNKKIDSFNLNSYGIHASGNLIPISLIITTHEMSGDTLYITYINDLSENKKLICTNQDIEETRELPNKFIAEYIVLLDLDKNILSANATFKNFTFDYFNNNPIYEYVTSEHQIVMQETFDNVLKTGNQNQYEISYMTKSGKVITYHSHILPIKYETRVFAFLIVINREYEQPKVDKFLQFSESNLISALSSIQEIYFQIDSDGIFTSLSPSLKTILGYDPEKLIENKIKFSQLSYMSQDDLLTELTHNNGFLVDKYKYFIHKNGSPILLSTSANFFYGASDKVIGIEGTVRNIRESENIDNSLRQSEKRFRAIFERSAAGIAVVDLDGHLTITNPALQNMLGYSENEIANMVFLDYTHPDDVELNWKLQQEIITGKRAHYKMEKRCIRKTGEIIWCSVNVSAVHDDSGAIKSVIGVLEDITKRKLLEENLRQSTAKFKAIYNSISDAAIFVDTDYRIITINPAVSETFGYSYSDLESQSTAILYLHHLDFESKKISHFNVNASAERKLYEMEYKRKDGSIFIGETQGSKIVDEAGCIIGFISIIRDISDRKKAEKRLRLSQKIFEDTAKAILITDDQINIIDVNDAFCNSTGYNRKEILGKKPNILQSGLHGKDFYEEMWNSLLTTGIWQGEIWDRKKNGDLFPNWATISTVKDENGVATNYVSMLTDISHLKETEKRLEQLAHFDQLTGLPNRMIFHSHLKNAVHQAKINQSLLAVMYIDLDGFKQVNDSLGHTAGDKLLIEIGKRLKKSVFKGDTIARLGGDEFAIILNNLSNIETLHFFAKHILNDLSISLYYEGKELRVTGSVGIATYPHDGECDDSLLRNADHAMYFAKQNGKSTYQLFASEMNKKILERIHLEADLRRAIKNQEFFILYQPKFNLTEGIVVGVEALVRWNHPERGIIMPQDFISFAEDSNLIIELGQQVINQACHQARILNDNRENKIPVAINISVRQFKHGNIVKEIQNSLKSSNLPARLLEIELTESLVMDDIQHTVEILEELKTMGIKISIDDFGTGYSSLSYLKKLPVDNLKIDRSFVLDITESDDDRAIISAILSMAKSLNLHVIAEGVENKEQLDFLSKHHCYEIQGFFISPPIPFEQLEHQINFIENQ